MKKCRPVAHVLMFLGLWLGLVGLCRIYGGLSTGGSLPSELSHIASAYTYSGLIMVCASLPLMLLGVVLFQKQAQHLRQRAEAEPIQQELAPGGAQGEKYCPDRTPTQKGWTFIVLLALAVAVTVAVYLSTQTVLTMGR